MKKGLAFIIFFGISCCFLFLPALSIAESETNVSVGLKTWYTGWKSKEAGGVPSEEAVFLVGPSIKFSKDKLFGGITYVTSTKDFEFKRPTRTDTRSRNDIDAIIGYMIHQRVGLFTGLKYVFGETKEVEPGQPDSSSKYRLYGMAYGATINYPVPDTPMVLEYRYLLIIYVILLYFALRIGEIREIIENNFDRIIFIYVIILIISIVYFVINFPIPFMTAYYYSAITASAFLSVTLLSILLLNTKKSHFFPVKLMTILIPICVSLSSLLLFFYYWIVNMTYISPSQNYAIVPFTNIILKWLIHYFIT